MYDQIMRRLGWGLVMGVLGFVVIVMASGLTTSESPQKSIRAVPPSKPSPRDIESRSTESSLAKDSNNSQGTAQEKAINYGRGVWAPPQPRLKDPRIPREEASASEITSAQLVWFSTDETLFPAQAKKLVEAWVNQGCIDVKKCGSTSTYTLVDLDGDKHSEIIVRSNEAFSGGRTQLVLKRKGSKWIRIGEFQGGFVLQLDENNPVPYRIVAYYRSGVTYQNVYEYKSGRYQLVSQQQLPAVITETPHWDKLWQQLNGYID